MPTTAPTEPRKRTDTPTTADREAACALAGVRAPRVPERVVAAAVEVARLVTDLRETIERRWLIENELLPAAGEREQAAFATALASGATDEPEPTETLALQREFAALERRAAALEPAHEAKRQELIAAVDQARARWLPELEGDVSEATARYDAAVAEVRASFGELSATVAGRNWLADPMSNPKGINRMGFLDAFVDAYERPRPVTDMFDLLASVTSAS